MTLASNTKVLGIIPARWGSTRFPGKPLHLIGGKPLIQHVWERCSLCQNLDACVVATDDDRIAEAVTAFGGEVVLTASDHPSGTDRIAEVARTREDFAYVINIQGDEPLISPDLIDQLAQTLIDNPDCEMVTAANPMNFGAPEHDDPNIVKVVLDHQSNALYFSRSAIPFPRSPPADGDTSRPQPLQILRHKGIYGFTRSFLLKFVSWKPSALEMCEQLEQLRALENGAKINVIITTDDSPGIDTPEQADIMQRQFLTE
ncbi:MAG: 3-deoxy-manno-octulosonate cytidylyltransferase [Verrucomicrobia bacterium]|nr:3-deoxy-manno-octulosonate cytidylyltransferase [Verrucomicrobiota bacterium]